MFDYFRYETNEIGYHSYVQWWLLPWEKSEQIFCIAYISEFIKNFVIIYIQIYVKINDKLDKDESASNSIIIIPYIVNS